MACYLIWKLCQTVKSADAQGSYSADKVQMLTSQEEEKYL